MPNIGALLAYQKYAHSPPIIRYGRYGGPGRLAVPFGWIQIDLLKIVPPYTSRPAMLVYQREQAPCLHFSSATHPQNESAKVPNFPSSMNDPSLPFSILRWTPSLYNLVKSR